MADDKTGLLSTSRPTPPPQSPTPGASSGNASSAEAVYHDSSQSPNSSIIGDFRRLKLVQILYVSLVVVMILITMCLSIYRGADAEANRGTYFMLGVCLLGFAVVEVCLIFFARRGDLPKGKTWFLYFVGFCVILESIFTDILLFQ